MIIRNKRICILSIVLLCSLSALNLQSKNTKYQTGYDTTRNKQLDLVKDNPIIAMLDSMAKITFKGMPDFGKNREALNVYRYASDFVPAFSDSVYAARIAKLNRITPFGFVYNPQVKQYIDLYAVKMRSLTERILGMSGIYFPLFEEQLDRFNLPLELKYLPVIESALNPIAKSHAGAAGLWQFMYGTGKMYDLAVSSYVDDRNDPYKATIAACEHMKDLYAIYNDWALVLAAYNSGAGNVNRAIRKAGGIMDYWTIQRFLPRETRDYVPAFIAASYVMHYAAEHNLYPVFPGILASEIDTVTVKQVLSFDQISEMFSIPVENIRFLNPGYTKDLVPASEEKSFVLRLPVAYIADYINNEDALYCYKTQKSIQKEKLIAQLNVKQSTSFIHVVKKGETLSQIANKYKCSVYNLKKWNGLKKNTVKSNTELIVYGNQPKNLPKTVEQNSADSNGIMAKTDNTKKGTGTPQLADSLIGPPTLASFLGTDVPELYNNKQNSTLNKLNNPANKTVYHTIRQGDTLWSIANKYKGVTIEQIKKWNNIKNGNAIKPGQKIKISMGNS